MKKMVSTPGASRRFMCANWNSYSKSARARRPRTIAVNPRKAPLFSIEERIGFIRDALPRHGDRISFAANEGLLVDFCHSRGATVIVRGLRALADFEYEFQFAHMNRRLAPGVDTVFFMTDERNHYVSSSLVKEVASLGGDVTGLVPAAVVTALGAKYRK